MYYLQERGLLVKYYRDLIKAPDKTGYQSLISILGVENMEKFQDEWEAWVLGLDFP